MRRIMRPPPREKGRIIMHTNTVVAGAAAGSAKVVVVVVNNGSRLKNRVVYFINLSSLLDLGSHIASVDCTTGTGGTNCTELY